jgi:hypothetical protein
MLHTAPNSHSQVITVLCKFRQEWQEAAAGKGPLDIEENIGMVLADLINSLGLASHEQSLVLGPQLFAEMRDLLPQSSRS